MLTSLRPYSKCKLCERRNYVKILEDDFEYTAEHNEAFQTLGIFECRGIELIHWIFGEDEFASFSAESGFSSNFSFEEGEYYDVQESTGNPVSIVDLDSKLEKE